jgi:hypothetical protein
MTIRMGGSNLSLKDRYAELVKKIMGESTADQSIETTGGYPRGKEEGRGGKSGGKEFENGWSNAFRVWKLKLTELQQGARDLVRRKRKRKATGQVLPEESVVKPKGKKVTFA